MEIKTKDNKVISLSSAENTILIDGSEVEPSEARKLRDYLREFLNNLDYKRRMEEFEKEFERVKKEKEEKEAKKKASREKTLQTFIKKLVGKPYRLIETPPTRFGTTMDHKYRVIALGAPDEEGVRVAVIWSGGERWSDNSGSHYGESSLEIMDVKMETDKRDKPYLTRNSFRDRVKLYDIPEYTPEVRKLFRGGQISPSRLEKLMPVIKHFIPDFEPLLPPNGHTLMYNGLPRKSI